jgi:hypothetical protein
VLSAAGAVVPGGAIGEPLAITHTPSPTVHRLQYRLPVSEAFAATIGCKLVTCTYQSHYDEAVISLQLVSEGQVQEFTTCRRRAHNHTFRPGGMQPRPLLTVPQRPALVLVEYSSTCTSPLAQ